MTLNPLEISLAFDVPASLRNIPEKCNIMIHLWTNCFYHLLENLLRSSFSSQIAYEYLQEFIYYAYTFYFMLFKRNKLSWIIVQALGNLAQYRIVIVTMVPSVPPPSFVLYLDWGSQTVCPPPPSFVFLSDFQLVSLLFPR